ncbi:MAG: radical SAM protein [Myxococcales bacterium]|nr:radical SAM protein [Myxococcales bacterium]
MPSEPGPARPVVFSAPGIKRYAARDFTPCNPESFRPVSLTGARCALSCAHCEGKLLRAMVPARPSLLDACARLARAGTRGVLITGGCDRKGRVPLAGLGEELRRVRDSLGLSVAVHTGLLDRAAAEELAQAGVERAMLDLIGARETAREVYHLEAGPEDYEASLAALVDSGVPTLPHIVLGLHYGALKGERAALEMVRRHRVAGLVLVVLTPLPGTPMASVAPPPIGEVEEFFHLARRSLPELPVWLGCARPCGPARRAIDRAALRAGLDGIAFPAEGIVARARASGREVVLSDACCGFVGAPGTDR